MAIKTQKRINPDEYYSASKIIDNGWIPWIKSVQTFTSLLKSEAGQEMYKPIIRQAGKYLKYHVKGESLLLVLNKMRQGKLIT